MSNREAGAGETSIKETEEMMRALEKHPDYRPLPDSAWWEALQRVYKGFNESDGGEFFVRFRALQSETRKKSDLHNRQ